MNRLRLALLVLLAGVSLSACSLVPIDSQPQRVNPSSVPYGLLHPTIKAHELTVTLWYYDGSGRPYGESRRLRTPLTMRNVLHDLARPYGAGVTTAVPRNWTLTDAQVSGTQVALWVDALPWVNDAVRDQRLMGQLQLSLSGIFGVRQVVLHVTKDHRTLRATVTP